jgi:hypothetical protein
MISSSGLKINLNQGAKKNRGKAKTYKVRKQSQGARGFEQPVTISKLQND